MNPHHLLQKIVADYSDDVEHIVVTIEKWIPVRTDRSEEWVRLEDLGSQIIHIEIARMCPRKDAFEQNVLMWDKMPPDAMAREMECSRHPNCGGGQHDRSCPRSQAP